MQEVKIHHEGTKEEGFSRPLAPAARGSFEAQRKKRKAPLKTAWEAEATKPSKLTFPASPSQYPVLSHPACSPGCFERQEI